MLATFIDGRHRSRIWLGAATLFLSAMATSAGAPAARPQAAEPVFLVIYRAGPEWPPGKTLAELPLREHGRYMLSLHQRGVLRMAGGFADDSGGAAVLQVPDMTAAKAIADADPAVTSGLFVYELRPWRLMPWAEIAARQTSATTPPTVRD